MTNYSVDWSHAVLPVTGPVKIISGGSVSIVDRRGVADVEFEDKSTGTAVKVEGTVFGGGGSYYGVIDHPTIADAYYTFGAYVYNGYISGMVTLRDPAAEDSGGQWGGR